MNPIVKAKWIDALPTYKQGFGTLYYRGAWNLFDQIIVNLRNTGSPPIKWNYIDVLFYSYCSILDVYEASVMSTL